MSNVNVKTLSARPHPAQDPVADIMEMKTQDQLNDGLVRDFVKRSQATVSETSKLLEQTLDARAALDVLCDKWKIAWMDFQDSTDQRLRELRMSRMAIDSEMRQLMAGFREVRSFFLDKDYAIERERLLEFVEICERLQRLKASGFLDTVADTMLRLATPESSLK